MHYSIMIIEDLSGITHSWESNGLHMKQQLQLPHRLLHKYVNANVMVLYWSMISQLIYTETVVNQRQLPHRP